MKRILLISHEMTVTGAPIALLQYAEYFRDAGYDVDVASILPGKFTETFSSKGFLVQITGSTQGLIDDFCEQAINKGYALVVCNTIVTYRFVASFRERLPVVWMVHEVAYTDRLVAASKEVKKVLCGYPYVYTVSDYARKCLSVYNEDIRFINNSVVDCFVDFVKPAKFLRLGYIGAINPNKNIKGLILAFLEVQKNYPDITLDICGIDITKTGLIDELKELAKDNEGIRWLGQVQGEKKRAFFNGIDCLCLPSYSEAGALTILEGAMYGKAILTTDCVGTNYMAEAGGGIIVKAGDADALRDAISSLAGDLDQVEQMQHCARHNYLKYGTPALHKKCIVGLVDEMAKRTTSAEVKVSVALPIYNMHDYLRDCLDSILSQSLSDIEVICVDDESTDDTQSIIREYMAHDSRVKLVTQKNAGAGAARNSALAVAKGKYVCFFDPDDRIAPDALQQMYDQLQAEHADVVLCRNSRFDGINGTKLGESVFPGQIKKMIQEGRESFEPAEFSDILFLIAGFAPWNKMFRRSFVEEKHLRFQAIRRTNDMFFVTSAMANAKRIAVIDKALYEYRVGIKSISSDDSLAGTVCDACQALHDRLVADGLFETFQLCFFKVMLQTFTNSFKICQSQKVIDKLYPRMRSIVLNSIDRNALPEDWIEKNNLGQAYKVFAENEDPMPMIMLLLQQARKDTDNCKSRIVALEKASSGNGNGSKNLVPAAISVAATPKVLNFLNDAPLDHEDCFPDTKPVSIIIPIYNAYDCLKELLTGLFKHTAPIHDVILVNDASPDPRIVPYLRRICKKHKNARLINNVENKGFSHNINLGASLTQHDFVILNTDTVVPDRWIPRLFAPIWRLPNATASVTPMSSDAFELTVPAQGLGGTGFVRRYGFEKIDRALSSVPADPAADVIRSGYGFAMAISRKAWNKVGPFAEEVFGRGYHEETDWCMRARRKGYESRVAPNVFIPHLHNGSFSTETKDALLKRNYEFLVARNPELLDPHFKVRFVESVSRIRVLCCKALLEYGICYLGSENEDAVGKYFEVVSSKQSLVKRLDLQDRLDALRVSKARIEFLTEWRIDCQFASADFPDFVNVASSDGVSVAAPSWMKNSTRDGRCVTCKASKGKVSFKSSGTGRVAATLRGQAVLAQDGKTRVPFYVDFVSVKVNGREMLKGPTSVWHDAPCRFSIDVKKDEAIEIEVATRPHTYDRATLRGMLVNAKLPAAVATANVDEILDDPMICTFLQEKLLGAALGAKPCQEQKPNLAQEVSSWRMDCRYLQKDVQTVLVREKSEGVSASMPAWMKSSTRSGLLVVCKQQNGVVSFMPQGTGKIEIGLSGQDVRTKTDAKERIPFYVDYTSVKVNGEELLKVPTVVWHDAPMKFAIDVKAGEEIKIEVQTVPHVYERAVLRDMLLKAKLPVAVTGKNVDAILDEPAMLAFQRRPMEEVAGVLGSWNVDCHYTEAEVGAFELTNGDADVWSRPMHGTDAFLRVMSEASRRKLTFKSKGAGDVRIALQGPDVFAASDGKTPLPAHADFTSVKVRGKEMLAKPVSVCRAKPQWFTIKVAAGEWVDVEVSTAPHVYGRSALKDLLLKGKWPVSVPPVCVDEWLSEPLFNRYLTRPMDAEEDRVWTPNLWRMDLSCAATDVVELEPIGASADLTVTSPAWMNRSGKRGLVISGSATRSRISCVAQGAGQVTVELRGQDVRMRTDEESRVPFCVDYTSVKVCGVEMLKEKVSVWHDKLRKFTIDMQAGETLEIAVVTTPHVYERTVLRDMLLKAKLPVAVDAKNVDQILDAPEMMAYSQRPQEVLVQETVLPEVLKEGARPKSSRRAQKEARRVAALERRADENARRAEEMLTRLQEANAHAEEEKRKVEELEKRLAAAQQAAAREKRRTEAKAKEVADLKASEAYQVGMSVTKPARAIKRALTGKK